MTEYLPLKTHYHPEATAGDRALAELYWASPRLRSGRAQWPKTLSAAATEAGLSVNVFASRATGIAYSTADGLDCGSCGKLAVFTTRGELQKATTARHRGLPNPARCTTCHQIEAAEILERRDAARQMRLAAQRPVPDGVVRVVEGLSLSALVLAASCDPSTWQHPAVALPAVAVSGSGDPAHELVATGLARESKDGRLRVPGVVVHAARGRLAQDDVVPQDELRRLAADLLFAEVHNAFRQNIHRRLGLLNGLSPANEQRLREVTAMFPDLPFTVWCAVAKFSVDEVSISHEDYGRPPTKAATVTYSVNRAESVATRNINKMIDVDGRVSPATQNVLGLLDLRPTTTTFGMLT